MRHARVYGLVALAAVAVAAVAFAQTAVTPVPDNAPAAVAPLAEAAPTWGDPKAGATKAGACAACHGLDGNPTDPQYPRIAGQNERFTAHQLALFKSGERNTGLAAVMLPFAAALSPQDMRDIGAWFATQTAAAGVADDSLIARGAHGGRKYYQVGEQLYRRGDAARGIPACLACHGPAGGGNPGPAYPALAGQQSAYVARRLQEYRAGTASERDPHLFNIMAAVSRSLTDDEIQALSTYLQGLHQRPAAAATPVAAH